MYCTTISPLLYLSIQTTRTPYSYIYTSPLIPLYSMYCTTTCMYCISPLTFLLYTFPFKLPYSYILPHYLSNTPLYYFSLNIHYTMYCTTISPLLYLSIQTTRTPYSYIYTSPLIPLYSMYCTTTCMYCISPLTFLLYTFPFKLPYSYILPHYLSNTPLYYFSLNIHYTMYCTTISPLLYTFPFKLRTLQLHIPHYLFYTTSL